MSAELAELARQVLALSASRDAELRARMAARQAGFAEGAAQAEAQWSAGYAAAVADVKAAEHGLVSLARAEADTARDRWHLCCLPCRRRGHQTGCRACQDRTRATFAEALPGEYAGGAVAWAPELVRGVA